MSELTSLPFLNDGTRNSEEARANPFQHLLQVNSSGQNAAADAQASSVSVLNKPTQYEPFGQAERAIDWPLVAILRANVAGELSRSLEGRTLSNDEQRALAQEQAIDAVRQHVDTILATGGDSQSWSAQYRELLTKAVLDSIFGLGRLQELVEADEVENIDIFGHDNVYLSFADGRVEKYPPVAESDEALIADIQFLAAQGGEGGRPFSNAHPRLSMDLPGSIGRLQAEHPVISRRPKIVIRVHRFIDVSLEQLAGEAHQTLTRPMQLFLSAAARAGMSMVVSGFPGVGKTTFLRGLCNELDPLEKIVTIEKDRELHLDFMGDRHLMVTPLQYRPGQGEMTASGAQAGEISLVDLLEDALRLDAQRIVVGEVRGSEIDAMFQAMQGGVGSFSTLHAASPSNAIERMVTLTQRNLTTTPDYAYRQVAEHIDLIIQLNKRRDPITGRPVRYVEQIAQIQPGETSRPIAAPLFEFNRRLGRHVFREQPTPEMQEQLELAGLAPEFFTTGRQDFT